MTFHDVVCDALIRVTDELNFHRRVLVPLLEVGMRIILMDVDFIILIDRTRWIGDHSKHMLLLLIGIEVLVYVMQLRELLLLELE